MATKWIILLQHILLCRGEADLIRNSVVLSNKVPEKGISFLLQCYSNGRMWVSMFLSGIIWVVIVVVTSSSILKTFRTHFSQLLRLSRSSNTV